MDLDKSPKQPDRPSLNGSNGKQLKSAGKPADMLTQAKSVASTKRQAAFKEADEVLSELRSIAPDVAAHIKKEAAAIEQDSIRIFRDADAELAAVIERIAGYASDSLDSVTTFELPQEVSISN